MDVITGILASELDAMGQTSADGGVLLGRVVSKFACFLGDLIIPMAADVMREIKYIAKEKYDPQKVQLLLNYSLPGKDMDVPDPWGRSEAAFHEVYDLIEEACEAMIRKHTSKKQP